jgi:hypothetical protein
LIIGLMRGDDVSGTEYGGHFTKRPIPRATRGRFEVAGVGGQINIDAQVGQVEVICELFDKRGIGFGVITQMVLDMADAQFQFPSSPWGELMERSQQRD